jgi:UDP-MurNAc hydroxylase
MAGIDARRSQESAMTHEVSLVNHASLLHEIDGLRLLSDPWLSGTVFADGWELVHMGGTTVADLSPDVIWLSHEHPDHFSPGDLKVLPKSERGRVQVITRLATDRKVAAYCAQQGFAVTEMLPHTWVELSNTVRVMTGSVGTDSWLAVTDGMTTVLNLNDCQTNSDVMAQVAELVGPVDLLASQFSYASWMGNPGDATTPRRAAANVFEMLAGQLSAIRPRQFLPFAAFVRFGHATNAWWNQYAPRVDNAAAYFAKGGTDVVVLFPGDSHVPGQPGPRDAISRWDLAYADAAKRPLIQEIDSVLMPDMNLAWEQMAKRLREDNDWQKVVRDLEPRLEPTLVRLEDLGIRIVHNIFSDELSVLPDSNDWDVNTTSDVFVEVFRNRWGRGTLTISGRLRLRYATALRFFRQTQLYYSNNLNRSYPESISTEAILEPKPVALRLVI